MPPIWAHRPATTVMGGSAVVSGPGRSDFVKGGVSRQNRPGSVTVSLEQAATLQGFTASHNERSTMIDYSKHVVLDLFAGTGVGVALKRMGVEEFGVEKMPEAIAVRTANGMKTVYEDVWDAHHAEELIAVWRINGVQWTLWASPPCQTFSLAGNGAGRKALDDVLSVIRDKAYLDMDELRKRSAALGDERIGLVLSPLHYAIRFRPTFVVFEQVPPVLPVWEAMAVELREAGYSVWTGYIHAEQYGVPQTRKRAYLMARNDGHEAMPPVPTHSKYHSHDPSKLDPGVKRWVDMETALNWPVPRPAPTVTGGGSMTGGAEPFGRRGRQAIRDAALSSPITARAATPLPAVSA